MKRLRVLLVRVHLQVFVLVVLLVSVTCIAGNDGDVTIGGGESGTTVTVEEGQTLRVELEGNPTTGYEWEVSAVDEAVLRFENSDFDADSDAEGSGGIVTLTFEAVETGTTLLELIERPSWEPPSESHRRFTITVRIA